MAGHTLKEINLSKYYDKYDKVLVFVDNPRLTFIKIAKMIEKVQDKEEKGRTKTGISRKAVVSDSAKIGKDCYIGDFVLIGNGCIVGDNTIINSRAVLKNSIIGNQCIIESGSIIGEDGFAFERETNTLELKDFLTMVRLL